MLDEHVPLFKRAFVQQQFQSLTRRQLALAVLCVNALLTTTQPGSGTFLFELLKNFLHGFSL
jgi:hypothetical protein